MNLNNIKKQFIESIKLKEMYLLVINLYRIGTTQQQYM